MGDENPIRTLGDYSKPSHEGYRNTIELPVRTTWYLFDPTPFGKERTYVYFNFPFTIKLAIGLNVFQQYPSPHERILPPDSLLNSFHRVTKDEDNDGTAVSCVPMSFGAGVTEWYQSLGYRELEEDDMEIDIEEDENEPELTYPYEEVDPLNPPPPASESEPDDEIKVVNSNEHEDETVLASVYETAHELVEKKGKEKDKFYGKLILELGNEVHSSMDQGTAAMEKLVEKLGNTEDKVECKKLKKELKEARTKDSVDAAIAAERARQANVKNNASGFGLVRGQDAAPAICECTFAGFMKCNHVVFDGVEGAVELRRWFEKTKSVFEISECAEGKKVKFAAATLEGPALTWWKTKDVYNNPQFSLE
nr:putative reverse transcriptase domain-containing protein [Tanacetum cinerariifolium]